MKIILKEYWKILRKQRVLFFLLLFLVIITNIIEIITPVFYKDFANEISGRFSDKSYSVALNALVIVAGLYSLEWITWRIFESIIIKVEGGGKRDLSKKVFEVLQKQKYDFFQNEFSGSLVKKASRFVSSFERIIDFIIFQIAGNLFLLTGGVIVFYFQDTLFSLYLTTFFIVFLLFSIVYSLYQFRFHVEASSMDSKIFGKYADSFSNIFTVKTSTKELEEQKKINEVSDQWFIAQKKAWFYMFLGFGGQAFLWISFEIFLNYQFLQEWKDGNLTVGDFILFNSIILIVMHKLWDFGHSLRHFFGALADSKEVAEIIEKDDEEKDEKSAEDFVIQKGEIELKNVNFSYTTTSQKCFYQLYPKEIEVKQEKNLLFKNLNLKIRAGEKVAFVGESGSGKTTITKLLFRFYEILSGEILFDNKNSKEITLHSLRSQISLVPQRPELFHRTIKENILFAKSDATDVDIYNALKKARAFDFVNALPQKMDTLVGERGVKLSGGEAQRIAIARAFLENAPIVILDEATSALDSVTEQNIQEGIFELIEDKTAIVIAHRLSTILKMDRIIVMQNGEIIEEGVHNDLLKNRGKYAQMWEHQSGGFLGDV